MRRANAKQKSHRIERTTLASFKEFVFFIVIVVVVHPFVFFLFIPLPYISDGEDVKSRVEFLSILFSFVCLMDLPKIHDTEQHRI